MLRLNPPGFERFLQTPQFVATFGGGEANVAVAVATYGVPARYVTVIPPNNAISDAFVAEMRKFGVDPSYIVRGKGRFGIYFVENGANQRPSKVLYDREGSAIALAKPGDIDFVKSFEGAGWFHITGITPAISEGAAKLAVESVRVAKEQGLNCFVRSQLPKESVEMGQVRARSDARTDQVHGRVHRQRRGLPDGARDQVRGGCPFRHSQIRMFTRTSPRPF